MLGIGLKRSSMVMRRIRHHQIQFQNLSRGAEQKSFGKSVIAIGMGAAALGSLGIATFAAGKWEAPPPPPPPPTSSSNKNNSSRTYNTSNKTNSSRSYDSRRSSSPDGGSFGTGLKIVGIGAILGLCGFLVSRYRICQPNELLVVYGATMAGGGPKVVTGGGTFVFPIVQGYRYLSLEPFAIEIALHGALSAEKVRVNVPSAFTIAVSNDGHVEMQAIKRLLDMDEAQVRHQSEEIILGQLRSVIASMSIDEINRDRIKFESNIRDHCEQELQKIGLGLINVNIINIEDESGVIEAMGQKAAAEAVQKAVVDVALHEKEGAIGKETEDTEKAIQVASLTRDRDIGMKNAQITAAVRTAELDAERVKGENEAAKLRAESDALLQTARALAYRSGETSEKEAEAAVVEAENIARAKAAQAEAKRIEEEKRAELEAPAKAQKAKVTIDAEARAAKLKIEADAEAHALLAKYRADARGEYERLARKAEGLGMIVQNCGGADKAFQLLMLEQLQPLARESAKAISNLNFDKVVVWENGGNGNSSGGGSSTSNFVRNLTSAVPPAMDVLKHVGGFENIEKLMPSTNSLAVTDTMKDYQSELLETFRGIFDAYDQDRDGRINRDEFEELLNSPALEEFKSLRDGITEAKKDLESRIDRNGGLMFSDIEEVMSMELKKRGFGDLAA